MGEVIYSLFGVVKGLRTHFDVRDLYCEADVGIYRLLLLYSYKQFGASQGNDTLVGAIWKEFDRYLTPPQSYGSKNTHIPSY